MSTISTREFVINDYEQAVALWNLADGVEVAEGDSKEEIRAYLLRNPSLSRVAEENGTIVGAVLCGHDGRRGLIYHLAVAAAHHGKGIGKRLAQECIMRLRTAGIARALILVAQDNASAHSFWLRTGWEDVPGAMLMGIDL
jgi:ribosomal protein S18 acetylase RimI-like enzyme